MSIDLVVGASVGSIFGLGVAAGYPAERIVRTVRDSTPLDLFRFYMGRLRAGRRNPIARLLLEAGEGKTFDDLQMPFAVTVTDMESGTSSVINSGPVLDAVQASIALPFVARPGRIGDRWYVDGGLLNTIPVEVARSMGADRVIAVRLGYNYAAPRVLRQRPWTRPILQRLGGQSMPQNGGLRDQFRFGCRFFAATYDPPLPSEDADVTIWPELGNLSPNSIFGAQFCLEQGYKAARDIVMSCEL